MDFAVVISSAGVHCEQAQTVVHGGKHWYNAIQREGRLLKRTGSF